MLPTRTLGRLAASLLAAAVGATTWAIGPGAVGTQAAGHNPIDHVIVLMQENRSFDSYFGMLHFEGQPRAAPLPPGSHNPDPTDPDGPGIRVFHKTATCEVADVNHSWTGTHQEIDGGLMDGFTAANAVPQDPTGSRGMGFYTDDDLPFYYALYNRFAIGDRYFASVPGPTFPNREYLLAATSFGHIHNDLPAAGLPGRSVFNLLDEAGVTWRIYFNDLPGGFLFSYVRAHAAGHVFPMTQYFTDAAAGQLPQVAFVDPRFGGGNNVESDEHPPANAQVGQQFVASVVDALFASPLWPSSALFLTYDEHGGYFDHVAPPPAVAPDDIPPALAPGDVDAAFDLYGIRVPVVVVSPFSRAHFVSHSVNDHTSILRFIETRFGLPALTRRDAAANPMLEFFDFDRPAFAKPPTLPAATIDPVQAANCAALAPGTGE